MTTHKNAHRSPVRPFDVKTAVLTTFGLGFLRPAPGTWGSVPPVLLVGSLATVQPQPVVLGAGLLVLALFSAACVGWGTYAEKRFGLKDAPEVVADETAGVCLPALTAAWVEPSNLILFLAAFVFFRVFDIAKPWPVKRLEQLHGGWGVLMDDIAAGFYAAAAVWLVAWSVY